MPTEPGGTASCKDGDCICNGEDGNCNGEVDENADCDRDRDGLDDLAERKIFDDDSPDCYACQDPDVDDDGIPDGYEVAQKAVRPESSPLTASAWLTLVYHPDQMPRGRVEQVAQGVTAFFARAGVPFAVHVQLHTANLPVGDYREDCLDRQVPADNHWLQPDNSVPGGDLWPLPSVELPPGDAWTEARSYGLTGSQVFYTHIGRLCLFDEDDFTRGDEDAVSLGRIRGQGSSEFVARFSLPRDEGEEEDRGTSGKSASAYWGLDRWERGVVSLLAHQLGHSLNLHHGGRHSEDCNPFYPSVMNHAYDFQPEPCLGSENGESVYFSQGAIPLKVFPGMSEVSERHDVLGLTPPSPKDAVSWTEREAASLSSSLLPLQMCREKGDLAQGVAPAVEFCVGRGQGPFCGQCGESQVCVNLELPGASWLTAGALQFHEVGDVRSGGSGGVGGFSGCDAVNLYPDLTDSNGVADTSWTSPGWAFDFTRGDHDDLGYMRGSLGMTVPYGRLRWQQCRQGREASCPADFCDTTEPDCPWASLGTPVVEPDIRALPQWLQSGVGPDH